MRRAVACLAVALVGFLAAQAAADCCNDCGCQCDCCKVCRCVPTTKKVTKICYGCECEDFCVPGPSKICGYKCVCPETCPCESKLFHHAHKEPIWQPTCAEVRTRSRLVKKELVKEVPSWKWEVVDLCLRCKSGSGKVQQAKDGSSAEQQAAAEQNAEELYSQDESKALAPVAAPSADETELVSHSTGSKLKRLLLPALAK